MLISEKFSVDTSAEKLYKFFLDANAVGSCVPGCESVEIVGENEYDSIIKTKVGTISAKFKVRTKISETVPCCLIRTAGTGKELRNLGQFKQTTEITLKELSENKTEVSYLSEVSIVGPLAKFGDRIMKSKANTMGKEFADSVKAKLKNETAVGEITTTGDEVFIQNRSKFQKVINGIVAKVIQLVIWVLDFLKRKNTV